MPKLARSTTITLLVAMAGGCANYATLQTPETMPERAAELGVGGTFNSYALEIESTATTTAADGTQTTQTRTSRDQFGVPALATWLRYGVTERLEVHGIAWFPLGASIGGKYMLVGERDEPGFIFSPGIDVGMPVQVSIVDDSVTIFDVYVPMHTGYRANEHVALYVTPKYIMRLAGGDLGHSVGAQLGVALGAGTTFMAEGGAYYDTLADDTIINGAIGIGFE
jgi:hypothetical protein